ncbi:MAG: amidohydrolase [Actinobacteria bacterium]|nr:amidohydrolase [Actinomycetota bacterium]
MLTNVDMGEMKPPEWMIRVKEDTFKGGASFLANRELDEVLEEMDTLGVERAVLIARMPDVSARTRKFVEERPDRFSLGLGGFDFMRPMPSIRTLQSMAADFPVSYTISGPSFWGDGMYPPDHAVYFPLYTKACELELPVCLNTGIPGPPLPAEAQNPIHLDRVCIRFPELKLCMVHGADPWWDLAIRLMIKYRNLRLMTSAWAPKRLPESVLHYLRTRGKNRIIFASDSPVLSQTRCITEATELDLEPDVLDAYLYGNAQEFFFGGSAEDRKAAP